VLTPPRNFPHHLEKPLLVLIKQLYPRLISSPPSNKAELYRLITCLLTSEFRGRTPNLWWLNYVALKYRFPILPYTTKTVIRSLSGIVSVTVFTKSSGCSHHCLYCPTQPHQPKSYLADEPAVMRAHQNHFDPFLQVQKRLLALRLSGHPINKVEIIIKGGTFSSYPSSYRRHFVQRLLDAVNKQPHSLSLIEAQKRNEHATSRLVGLNIETRPDSITQGEIKLLRELGVTHVELGVQILDDAILKTTRRGHTVNQVKQATFLLKEAGFKIGYHLMLNLPGTTPSKDLTFLKRVFHPDFCPDYLKIYPTVITRYTQLAKWYFQKRYQPYSLTKLLAVLTKFKNTSVPPWVRISRLGRDITTHMMLVDLPSNLRQLLKTYCPCLRCREIKNQTPLRPFKLRVIQYLASQRPEYFLEFIDQQHRSLAFLRLRLLADQGVIRELHVHGQATPLGQPGPIQHHRLGQQLLFRAEKITQTAGLKKIRIIAGIGVRPYFRRFGYRLQNTYMTKRLPLAPKLRS
jgi:elongator complex protein 3